MNKVEILDCRGMLCPMPIVELTKSMRKLKVGDELQLLADAIGAKEDVPIWCRRTGNELLDLIESDGLFTFHIKKVK
jgi:tRNA 2-thiouridine synthesizing protein A